MSIAHKGSRLVLSGNTVSVDFSTEYHDFNNDASGIQFGNLITPSGNPVYTMRPFEGVFGGGIAIEEGTTNLLSNPMFDNNISGWTNGNMTTPTWNSGFNDIKYNNGYMYITGSSGNGFTSGPSLFNLTSGGTYTVSAYIEGDGMDIYNKISIAGTVFYSGNGIYDDYTWSPSSHTYTKVNNRGIYRVEKTFTINSGSHSGNVFTQWQPRIGLNSANLNLKVYGYQIENKSFSTSIVNGTRAKGYLSYYDSGINNITGTLSFWYKPTINWNDTTTINGSNEGTHESLFTWGVPGQSNCIWGRRERDSSVMDFWYGTGGSCQYSTLGLSGNGFIHIAFTWKSGSQQLYINGASVSSIANSSISRPTTGYFEVGCRQVSSSYPTTNGIINDLIISTSTMSSEDISNIYISNRPLYNPYDYRATAY